jgi:hypothetical protein
MSFESIPYGISSQMSPFIGLELYSWESPVTSDRSIVLPGTMEQTGNAFALPPLQLHIDPEWDQGGGSSTEISGNIRRHGREAETDYFSEGDFREHVSRWEKASKQVECSGNMEVEESWGRPEQASAQQETNFTSQAERTQLNCGGLGLRSRVFEPEESCFDPGFSSASPKLEKSWADRKTCKRLGVIFPEPDLLSCRSFQSFLKEDLELSRDSFGVVPLSSFESEKRKKVKLY